MANASISRMFAACQKSDRTSSTDLLLFWMTILDDNLINQTHTATLMRIKMRNLEQIASQQVLMAASTLM